MTSLDLREAFNAVSDIVVNRPPALREFDQIYMKISDMLLQAELLSRVMDSRRMVFLGDGDAIGLTLVHLKANGVLKGGPARVHVLDFDERIVNSINSFATAFGLQGEISAELYNIAHPLPKEHLAAFDGFHTNPPFGASNGGRSVEAFLRRGDEALAANGTGCIVMADDPTLPWTQDALKQVQHYLVHNGFIISEVVPRFHHYHLDDDPDLTSCSVIVVRHGDDGVKPSSEPLPLEHRQNFYGKHSPLRVQYIRDRRMGGKLPSCDHYAELLEM